MLDLAIIAIWALAGQESDPREQFGKAHREQVIELAVAKAAENDAIKNQRFRFKKIYKEENLSDDGSVSLEKTETYLVHLVEGQTVEELIEINGLPVKEKKIKDMKSYGVNLDESFVEKFNFRASDRPPAFFLYRDKWSFAWLYDFEPKPDLEKENNADYVLNHMVGTIYIDDNYYTWRIEGHLMENVSVYGFLGKIYQFDFELQQMMLEDIMVGNRIEITVKYRALFVKRHKRYTVTYTDYEPN